MTSLSCPNATANAPVGNVGCFPRGKRAAIVRQLPPSLVSFLLCFRVSIPPAVRRQAYSFTTDGYGIFNVAVHTNFGACRTHGGGGGGGGGWEGGTNKPAQELTRIERQKKMFLTLPRLRIEPRAFGFEYFFPTL